MNEIYNTIRLGLSAKQSNGIYICCNDDHINNYLLLQPQIRQIENAVEHQAGTCILFSGRYHHGECQHGNF